jgi:hypothetical protein
LTHFVLRIPAKSTLERCSYPFSDSFYAKFVNKGKRKGRGCSWPRPFFLPANFFASYGPTRLAVTRGSNVAVTTSDGLVCTNVNLLPSGAMN